jgi:EmrB/QacA subfamily drug resistance transporter
MNLVKTRNDRDVLISTSIASSMVFIDTTAVNTVLPAIQRSLDTALTDAQWVVEIYMLFLASLLLLGGALGDRFGRRRVFRLGIILFAFASLACGLSQTPLQLIAARAFQGIAAALLTPASLALLNASFPPDRRAAAVGAWSAVTALAVPLGPVLGGALADWLSWHWIFFINLPLSIAALYALRNVERPRFDPQIASSFDLAGAVVITLALGGLVYGLLELSRRGLSDDFVLAGFVVSAIGLPLFIFIESRAENPLMPLSLFRIRTFTGINLATFLLYGGLHGSSFFIPFKFISTHGYSAAQAGAALLPLPLAIFDLVTRLRRHRPPPRPCYSRGNGQCNDGLRTDRHRSYSARPLLLDRLSAVYHRSCDRARTAGCSFDHHCRQCRRRGQERHRFEP